ncbi:hypothetical protein BABINDRAFT_162566 [Babjeviella inositovora NRRL Y-12698]|uniref:CoA-transferase family III n=1 Tax=Babjeviella inositovora NRRL Y-12698 TaxID=984486 RepID=A0A1E3QPA1_9ASCO|nr:uncharacterized protein BABINDRAFT_162566 [Babjeviella inositovora NRRL Y-12698]ODQ78902.1 hypothetical protein BABINDRAFT_162566 [Babjeviella inositovora NRRL Y-12698]
MTVISSKSYTITAEATRIFNSLVNDPRLDVPEIVKCAARHVTIQARHEVPFLPTPLKMTESSTALWAYLSAWSLAIMNARYGLDEETAVVDAEQATLYLFSFALVRFNGVPIQDKRFALRATQYDTGKYNEPYRALATNIYPTRDGKFCLLHGGLNATRILRMVGMPDSQPELTREEAIAAHTKNISENFDSHWLEITANERYRQSSTVCNTFEEFLVSEHGKAIKDDPIYIVKQVDASLPPVGWPEATKGSGRPLEGIRIIDFSRIIAGPAITKICALLGATVIRISSNPQQPDVAVLMFDGNLGKRDTSLNMKSEEGKDAFEALLLGADVIMDGFRPGSLDRLGFTRDYMRLLARKRGKGLILARENCYGWKGPLQHRSGWQQISDCLTGVAWAQGKFLGLDEPVLPLLPNADYQAGICGAIAILDAIYKRATLGGSYTVDLSLSQFNVFFQKQGLLPVVEQERLLKRYEGELSFRHYDDALSLSQKMAKLFAKHEPKLLDPEKVYAKADSNWGEEGEIMEYVKPPASFSSIKLFPDVGTTQAGTYSPQWP